MGAPELLALSLGLSVAVAALGWGGGRGVERLSADPRLRDRVWAVALILPALPPLVVGLMLLTPAPVHDIPLPSTSLSTALVTTPVEVAVAAGPTGLTFDPTLAAWAVLGIAALLAGARLAALGLRARRLLRIIGQAQTPDPAVTAIVETVARDLAIRPPCVGVSAATSEALLASLGRARLILPAGLIAPMSEPAAVRAVIAHELAHLKRGDHHALWLEECLLALLAFNPLVPPLRARRAAAREEACDALALSGAAPDARRAYARSLIEALRSRAAPPASGGLPALTFTGAGRTTAMHRLRAVMNPAPAAGRGPRLMAFGLGGLILALAGAGSLAVAGEREAVVRMSPAPAAPPTTVEERPRTVEPSAGARTLTADAAPDTPAPRAAESEQSRLTPEQEARYRNTSARQYQTICTSADPADVGFCSGVMFGILGRAPQNGFCAPATVTRPDRTGAYLSAFVDRGKREIAGMRPNADEGAYDFAERALKQAYPCEATPPPSNLEPAAFPGSAGGVTGESVLLNLDIDLAPGVLTTPEGTLTVHIRPMDGRTSTRLQFPVAGSFDPIPMGVAIRGSAERPQDYEITAEIRDADGRKVLASPAPVQITAANRALRAAVTLTPTA